MVKKSGRKEDETHLIAEMVDVQFDQHGHRRPQRKKEFDQVSQSTSQQEDEDSTEEIDTDGPETSPVKVEPKGSTMLSSMANLANTIVGSGMLALPAAFASCGYLLGTIFLVGFGTASAFGLHLLAQCALKVGIPSSFRRVTEIALPGERWSALIDAVVAFKCFGVATSYFVVIGDTMPPVIDEIAPNAPAILLDRNLWVMIGACVIAPLCFLQSLDKLKFTSAMSILFVIFLTLMVLVYAADDSLDACTDDSCKGRVVPVQLGFSALSQFTVFVFGFTCHQNIFSISNEIHDPTSFRLDLVILCSIMLAFAVYIVVAWSGYFTFGSHVESDVLVSFENSPVVLVARLFVGLLVCFSYPLQCHPSRACIISIASRMDPDLTQGERGLWFSHAVTTLFLSLSVLIALVVTELGTILAIVGATGSTTVSYILPGICYYKVFPHNHTKRFLAKCQLCAGFIIMPLALAMIAVRGSSSE